ncbi:MAG: CRISPR-associated protein Cas5 [Anaerolineae bacterium]|nr:CRISPR-associated protein Cas5 [Anaerolineae bacterium]
MRVLKVVAEGLTTSFRYPLFMLQVHPTFLMPPPATIYGHISSALGEWFDPEGVRFAYHFHHDGTVRDIEHVIVLSASTGKLKGTDYPKVLEGNVNPFERDMFFRPRLTLYVNRPEWESAFRSPRYAVALGRSQDLFTYTSIEVVELEQAECAYFENTILPHEMAIEVQRGLAVLMPRFLDYAHNRRPHFQQYLVVTDRVRLPNEEGRRFAQEQQRLYWVDPASEEDDGAHLGLAFHGFLEEAHAT